MIRLVLIHQNFVAPGDPGGTRHFELLRRLAAGGHRPTIVASNVNYLTGARLPALHAEQVCDGVRILRAPALPTLHRSFLWRVVSFCGFMLSSIFAGLRAGPLDVVMGTSPPLFQGLSAWAVSVIRRCPFVLEIRDLWPDFAIDMGVLRSSLLIRLSRWLERFLYRRARHLIVNSPAFAEHLARQGVPAQNITLIPNGVDVEMFRPEDRGEAVRAEFNLQNSFVVTYTGALGPANDVDCILRAAARLRDTPEIHFLLAGDGKERSRLEELARALPLPNLTFTGALPKTRMPALLAASDACVATLKDIPMFRMTYPNKVFDYMAAARPVVLAIDGVIRVVVEAAGAGIFVRPGDDGALADAVARLHANRARAHEMGARGREYVARHFPRDAQARQLEQLLLRLLETKG